MKKVLFTATVDSHILCFHIPFLKLFHDKGYEVHVATNGTDEIPYCDKKIVIPFERSPYKLNNLKAIKQLRKVINEEKYDIIHTHTPMGSVVTRLAAKQARRKYHTRVIYTAHGFHFYKGAPLLNWLLFYPVEKYLAKYTDTLITINQEDYELAKNKLSKRCKNIEYVPGVGIDEEKFNIKMTKKEKHELRESLGLKDDDFVLTYIARMDKNKNQGFLIDVMNELVKEHQNIHLLLVGPDELDGIYQEKTKNLNLTNNVHFLGFRKDIPELLKITDVSVSCSLREGLPVNIMEAMVSGLPVVATDARGVRDLINDVENGFVVDKNDKKEFINKIIKLYKDNKMNKKISKNNINSVKKYCLASTLNYMNNIYSKKKKVLHLLASNKYSGAENVACMIINNTSKLYDNIYCSLDGPISSSLAEKNIDFIPLKKISIKEFKNVVNIECPDIIHAHDVRSSFISAFAPKRIIKISHIHGNHLFMRKITLKSLLYICVSIFFKKIIWVSNSSYDNFCFNYFVKNKSIVLSNVIDDSIVKNKVDQDLNEYSYEIVFLGRLNEAKDPMRLLNILSKVIEVKNDIKCAIVGDGELYHNVEKYIKDNKLEKNVDIFGYKENPYKLLSSAKIMIMTSKHEGLPMVALEALSLGIPIISTPTDGLIDLINETCGYLSNNDNELINKILLFLNYSETEINKLKKSAYIRFREVNNINKYISLICKLYMED